MDDAGQIKANGLAEESTSEDDRTSEDDQMRVRRFAAELESHVHVLECAARRLLQITQMQVQQGPATSDTGEKKKP